MRSDHMFNVIVPGRLLLPEFAFDLKCATLERGDNSEYLHIYMYMYRICNYNSARYLNPISVYIFNAKIYSL